MRESEFISTLINKGREAQRVVENYSQERVDELTCAIAWTAIKNAQKFADNVVNETGMGDRNDKYMKIQNKVRGCLRDLNATRTVGVIEVDEERGLLKIPKPVGVVGAVTPVTNAEITPVLKAMCAVKARDAIIFAPHPRSKKSTYGLIQSLQETLKQLDCPPDLLQCIPEPTVELTIELMKQCDLIVATGGAGMVKSAYSSGKPAYGVGVGNAVVVVDETADIKDAARKIALGKTFDLATSCSSENSIIVEESIYNQMVEELQQQGGYLANDQQKKALQQVMWRNGTLNRDIVCQPAQKIAKYAGLQIPDECKFIIVEEEGVGPDYPFSGEKLSVVLTVYKYRGFENAIAKVKQLTGYQGQGHSCGIHSFDQERIMQLALTTKTSRVMVRQAMCIANGGSWENGMPCTTTLGCGTWGGNITTENITVKHFINVTWVSWPIKPRIPTDEELFGAFWRKYGIQAP